MDVNCGGITKGWPSTGDYCLRIGTELLVSPSNEISWIKNKNILIQSDFSTGVPNDAILYGHGYISDGYCVLTPNSFGQNGVLLYNTIPSTPTIFSVQWDYYVLSSDGADGLSFNYGPIANVDSYSLGASEYGLNGAVLVVSFIEWGSDRVELRYNGTLIKSVPVALGNPNLRRIQVDIRRYSVVIVSINGVKVLTTSDLGDLANTDYTTISKFGWRFGFGSRTGARSNWHVIDNVVIMKPVIDLEDQPSTQAPTSEPLTPEVLASRVRVKLEGRNYLHMREVEVWGKNGTNVALNKAATQSSTVEDFGALRPASAAVNGIFTDRTHTDNDQGKYH